MSRTPTTSAQSPILPSLLTEQYGPFTRLRGFDGQIQAQDTWCWAAAAASIDSFFNSTEASVGAGAAQCSLIQLYFGREPCKANRYEGNCEANGCSISHGNETGRLGSALDDFPNDRLARVEPRPIPFSICRQEIDAGRPFAVRVEQIEAIFHTVVVIGYNPDIPSLLVWDPGQGYLKVNYNSWTAQCGRWTHTYFTER